LTSAIREEDFFYRRLQFAAAAYQKNLRCWFSGVCPHSRAEHPEAGDIHLLRKTA
jgi:hypothetical protein